MLFTNTLNHNLLTVAICRNGNQINYMCLVIKYLTSLQVIVELNSGGVAWTCPGFASRLSGNRIQCTKCKQYLCLASVRKIAHRVQMWPRFYLQFLHFSQQKTLGEDLLWFIGDNFVAKTFRAHFKIYSPPEEQLYIKANFEFVAFCSSKYNSPQENMLVRLQSSLASVINAGKRTG